VFLAGAGFCLVRFLLGLGAVRGWRRRSRPVSDAGLMRLLETLAAALGCRRRVEVRETPHLTTPATAGWLRPFILLPAGWRAWSETERRAVLAHELAHIRRADYPAWLLARLSVAVHFYHPLVYWLAGRLQLQQELAADALAAPVAGGRRPYLFALAQLALRQEGRPVVWPARTFLSTHGTLMRRILMLRAKEAARGGWASVPARSLLAALMLGLALGVSALRGPAPGVAADAPADSGRLPAARPASARPPFDLTYVPPDAKGVVAFRPGAFFRLPGMKRHARAVNRGIESLCKQLKLPGGFGLKVEDIEQVTAGFYFVPVNGPKGNMTAMEYGPAMIRAARPFDWKKQLHRWIPNLEEVKHRGKVYYRGQAAGLALLAPKLSFHVPDDRTLLVEPVFGDNILSRLMRRGTGKPAPWARSPQWKAVERSLAAVALDNRDKSWIQKRSVDDEDEKTLRFFNDNVDGQVIGVEADRELVCQILLTCPDKRNARAVADRCQQLLNKARAALKEKHEGKRLKGRKLSCYCLAMELLRGRVKQVENRVSLRCTGKANLSDLFEWYCQLEQ
jgi:hypothetical protein